MAKLQGRSQVLKLLKEGEILEGVNINLNKELGRGSYATVYQAEWRSLLCVAKVFHTVIFPSYPAETWKQLAREIELLRHIRHPNIVQLLGFTETHSKIPSVIMERLDTNLTTLIKEHHSLLSFNMQVCILRDIAVGLSFLHEEPIVHRDLSSNNILLTEHLVAKISDLGLAKHIKSAEQQAGSFAGFGAQDYMPPEVLGQKPPQISPKTDVFSFGVVMLQIATGKPPDVRGRLNVDAEADRRKHHLELLGEKDLFCPLILRCLSESIHRPNASMLCEGLKKFNIVRKSTLKLTKAFHEEKVILTEQLKALQLQSVSDMQNMHKVQEQLQQEISTLQSEFAEAKDISALKIKSLSTELNDALSSNNKLQETLSASLNTTKQLVQQNQELARLLEATNNDLSAYKKNFSVLRGLFESLDVPSDNNVPEILQKCQNDGKGISVKLKDMENCLMLVKQSKQGKEKDLPTSVSPMTQKSHCSDSSNEVDNMAAAPSDDDGITCPLCHVTLGSDSELQLHYLQSCAGYDNEVDPMSSKPMGYHPPATQQNFGGNFDRSSDRLAPSSKETMIDRSRAAVGGGDGNLSGLSKRLVKFVWYPNDPFKVPEQKATLLSSFTASEGIVELFKDKNEDICSYSSFTIAVRIGKFDDGQLVIGEEMLEVEPYEVSNESDEIYLITKERNSPSPLPVNPETTASGVSSPPHGSILYHGMSQMTAPMVPRSYSVPFQEHFMPAVGTATNNKSSLFLSGDLSAHPGQKPVQETLDAAPYGMYGDAARLVGAKQDQDFGGGIGSANVMMSRENDSGAQKPGINLQNLSGIEDAGAQERVRALQEKLLKAEQERDESKRSMERSNAMLNNRIRRLEYQLNVTSAGNEAGMVDEIKKLNMRISELESTESLQSSGKHSDKGKVTHLSIPTSKNPTPTKTSPQNAKKVTTTPSGALKQPTKQTAKSVITVKTANGKQDVSCEPVSSAIEVKKGQRVVVCRANSNEYGTVRAVNVAIDGFDATSFIGIEMDLPSGITDGEAKGVRHFKCKPKHAVFVQLKNIFKVVE